MNLPTLYRTATIMLSVSVAVLSWNCGGGSGRSSQTYDPDKQQIFIGEDIAVTQTVYGKVRGFIIRDIYAFRGIPYGANTAGKNRFMPPQKPESWDGVRPAVFYGNSAPQDIYDRSAESYSAFVDHWNYDEMSEDCLRLNVWTPSISDSKKRPVLVWLHGGGFARGNGIEQDGYDGENISRYGDIVYVSINHRLGPLGFTDLSVYGEKYKESGNAGMLDIIAALEWVNENIENFGGDPGNVTVMGQSGGGAKVCTVAAMPSAKGLVHKGIALSGSSTGGNDVAYSQKVGRYILESAGLEPAQVDKLQEMPWEEYLALGHAAVSKISNEPGGRGRGGFSPVSDGVIIPDHFFVPNDANVPDIPMIFCTTFHEWTPNRDHPEHENITFDGVKEQLRGRYGERTGGIVDAYAKQFPEARPIEIWTLIQSNREGVVHSADTKLQQDSPVWMAWFGWESPLFDGRHRSFHCIDISFWFMNTDLMITHTGGGKKARDLSKKMADALISFMYSGDPNCKALPAWPQYTAEQGQTMILNDKCEVVDDPDREARLTLSRN